MFYPSQAAVPNPRYGGAIEAGMVFRHRSFDIYTKVVKVDGGLISTAAILEDGQTDMDPLTHYAEEFRTRWKPKNW